MAIVILCVVGLFFMAWVVLLRLEVEAMKDELRRADSKTKGAGREGTVSGMKRYSIGASEKK